MAAYAYSAINADGLVSDGTIHAPDTTAAREQLRIRGLLAERLIELPASGEDSARTFFKAIKPKTLQIFAQLGGQLPTLTLYVVHASNLLRNDWYIIFPAAIGAFFGIKKFKKSERG